MRQAQCDKQFVLIPQENVLVVSKLAILLKLMSKMLVSIRFLVQLQKSLTLESEKVKFLIQSRPFTYKKVSNTLPLHP